MFKKINTAKMLISGAQPFLQVKSTAKTYVKIGCKE